MQQTLVLIADTMIKRFLLSTLLAVASATYEAQQGDVTTALNNAFNQMSMNRGDCMPDTTGALNSPASLSTADAWRCDVPLSTPNALSSCIQLFLQRIQTTVSGSCVSPPLCVFPPSYNSDPTRVEKIEQALWNLPYPPQPTPYPGQQGVLSTISTIPCSAFVSDVPLVLSEGNLILKNVKSCVLDKQMLGRFMHILKATHQLNVQCVLGAGTSDPYGLGAPPPPPPLDASDPNAYALGVPPPTNY